MSKLSAGIAVRKAFVPDRVKVDRQRVPSRWSKTEACRIADEQIADWRDRRVSIADAALSMGYPPPRNWVDLRGLVIREIEIVRLTLKRRQS